jgi:acetyltransferase-like isoleucine patch superfamily enzyme
VDVVLLLVGLLPASTVKNVLLRLCGRGWEIARSATVAPCVLWRVGVLTMGDDSLIGFGNQFRNMRRVELGREAEINRLNVFTGSAKWADQHDPDIAGCLLLADQAAMTARHLFECAGGVTIGRLAVIGGFRSMVITRYMDLDTCRQTGSGVRIGERCMIASGSTLLPGVTVADRCVVGAGSVVSKSLSTPDTLYAGNPAKPVRSVEGSAFLLRETTRIRSRADVDSLTRDSR